MSLPIRTKLGQAPSDSPRTLDSNRRRLGLLFSTLIIGESSGSSSPIPAHEVDPHGTPSKADRKVGWLEWLSPARARTHANSDEEDQVISSDEHEIDISHDARSRERQTLEAGLRGAPTVEQNSLVYDLPDELLIQIFLRLAPTPEQITTLARVSRRFYALANSSQLWIHLFQTTPGFALRPDPQRRIATTERSPHGRWKGDEWVASSIPTAMHEDEEIPIHYPTLYRSRRALQRIIRGDVLSGPPHRVSLRDHTDSIYCVQVASPWLVTGSRDRSMRFWRLDDLRLTGNDATDRETRLVHCVDKAHDASVLSMRLELDQAGTGGTLVTGSSDMSAGIWKVELGEEVAVERVATLRGHTGGVLDVALSKSRIATASKDTTIRLYDRDTYDHLFTLAAHSGPVNGLCVQLACSSPMEQMVSASGDGTWIIWDMADGREIRRGGGPGRGLACVTWEGNYIVTGSNDRSIRLFSATDSSLIRSFDGHTDLVRSVAVDPANNLLLSGSYDQTVRIWDLCTGNLIRRIKGDHSSLIFGVAMDRGRIVSVSHDSTAQILTYGHDLPYRGLFA